MQEFKIDSEDPVVHWPGINISGKNILDLGCGRWDEQDQNKMTPTYFKKLGAHTLIGIDSSIEEIKYFRSLNLENSYFFAENIKTAPLVKLIIKQNNINIIKSNIEGKELLFLEFKEEDLTTVNSMYIEYHGHYIRNALEPKIKNLGFNITKVGHLWIDGFGVLFCEK